MVQKEIGGSAGAAGLEGHLKAHEKSAVRQALTAECLGEESEMKEVSLEMLLLRLQQEPLWTWISPEGLKTFASCFDLCGEQVPAGEYRQGNGRIGYLLDGSGRAKTEEGEKVVSSGMLFGAVLKDGLSDVTSVEFCPETDCTVVWMDGQIVRAVCYGACWFHVRLLEEIHHWLEKNQPGS